MVRIQPLSAKLILDTVQGTLETGSKELLQELSVTGIGEPSDVTEGGLTFFISAGFLKMLPETKASVIVVQKSILDKAKDLIPESIKLCIVCDDAYLGLARISKVITDQNEHFDWAHVEDEKAKSTSTIHETVKIAKGTAFGENVKIGARTVVHPNVTIGSNVTVGEDCVLFPGVVLYPRTEIGNRVRIHANVVLGGDGFGYAKGPQGSEKIWHLGRTIIQDDVEIGPGTTIDRGTIKDTVVEARAKIDNLVQIGHNGYIKSHALLCAQAGLAGNVTVGVGAILAGKAGIADKLNIGDGAIVGPLTGVSKDVPAGAVVMGAQPSRPKREWWKLLAHFERLPELSKRVKQLEKDKGKS